MAGHVITRYLDNLGKYDIINSSRSKLNNKTILIDINNISSVENLIKVNKPDVVINCIGILIEESNKNPDNAIFINSYFPHKLESLGRKFNFKLIHLSTGFYYICKLIQIFFNNKVKIITRSTMTLLVLSF